MECLFLYPSLCVKIIEQFSIYRIIIVLFLVPNVKEHRLLEDVLRKFYLPTLIPIGVPPSSISYVSVQVLMSWVSVSFQNRLIYIGFVFRFRKNGFLRLIKVKVIRIKRFLVEDHRPGNTQIMLRKTCLIESNQDLILCFCFFHILCMYIYIRMILYNEILKILLKKSEPFY